MMKRNIKIDYFRIVLSLLIVTVHAQPLFREDSLVGWFISNGIARIAVPCFFIISGYFLHQRINDKEPIKKYLLHTLIVYATWSIVYIPIYYQTIEYRSLITFALMGYYHLWFLPALIIGTISLIILKKIITNNSILLFIGIILYLCGYMMEINELPYRLFYNGIFFGYPFIILGYYIKDKNISDRIQGMYIYPIILFSLILLIIESYLGFEAKIYHNIFISLYILCPALLALLLKQSNFIETKGYTAKLASGIYYIHILVLSLIIPLSESYNIYKLPLIAIVSILLSIFIIIINKRIRIFL